MPASRRFPRKILLAAALLAGLAGFGYATWRETLPFPDNLAFAEVEIRKVQVVDRHREPLTITYQNDWNLHDWRDLHQIPQRLQQIFLLAEDRRFYRHPGVDWWARAHALSQNLLAGRIVRGASTITEQSVRMLHPRPRTFWSRWVETFEAMELEARFSKAAILEFYLNQVPYAHQRRGVVQAARHYFDRDLETLNLKEMMALAVLVRSPSRLDLRRGQVEIQQPVARLAERMRQLGLLDEDEYRAVLDEPLHLRESRLPVRAVHFVNHVYQSYQTVPRTGRLHTTLDSALQGQAQAILDQRVRDLRGRGVRNGAALVVDHLGGEILAWVNSGDFFADLPGSQIDAVSVPRQPGSTLKPFVYALALEKGWTAATLIDDTPLAEAVGSGLHSYRNYSRGHYGLLRLRDCLGNSLNIPAIRAIQFTGQAEFLERLRALGFSSLAQPADFYGDGLALGNGEVSLLELVRAYAALANQGRYKPLRGLIDQAREPARQVFSAEISSLIADILSDPQARQLEFGTSALLRFPVQTAVKTGTSTDYRDAWAVGFNHRYTVGVWLGNLDRQAMVNVSGASGPALVLRSLFAELNRHEESAPLYLSPRLNQAAICLETGLRADGVCPSRNEWFVAGSEPALNASPQEPEDMLALRQPSNGLQLAMDPRIPDEYEVFELRLPDALQARSVEWRVNGETVAITGDKIKHYPWPLARGTHTAQALVWQAGDVEPRATPAVTFHVK